MFKKSKQNFTHYIYTVYDSVSKKYRGCFYHSTDEEMVKITLPTILMDFPLRDIEIHRIGTFNEDTGEINNSSRTIIPTDCYLFPHSRLSSHGDDLSLEELDVHMKEKKNEIISSLSKNENEEENKEVVNE